MAEDQPTQPRRSLPRRILRWVVLIVFGGIFLLFGPLILIVIYNFCRPIQTPKYLLAPAVAQKAPEPTTHTLVQNSITTASQTAASSLISISSFTTPEIRTKATAINLKYAELKKYYASVEYPDGFGKIFMDYHTIHEEAKALGEPWRRQINNDFLRTMYDRGDWTMIIEFVRRWREYDNWDTAMIACRKQGKIIGSLYIAALVSEPTINRVFYTIRHHELPPEENE